MQDLARSSLFCSSETAKIQTAVEIENHYIGEIGVEYPAVIDAV